MERAKPIRLFKLRRADPGDLSFIYKLERLYIQDFEAEQLTRWQECIELHLDQWVGNLPRATVALHDGTRAGFTFWERKGENAVLASVNVVPSHRRLGVASTLLSAFEDDARSQGCSAAELGFVASNPARHLYDKFGYRLTGAEGRYVMMTKAL